MFSSFSDLQLRPWPKVAHDLSQVTPRCHRVNTCRDILAYVFVAQGTVSCNESAYDVLLRALHCVAELFVWTARVAQVRNVVLFVITIVIGVEFAFPVGYHCLVARPVGS